MKPTAYYIDGDILVYKSLFVSEVETEGPEEDEWSLKADLKKAKGIFREMMVNIAGQSPVWVCLSCERSENFRCEIFPSYKENRASQRKPLGIKAFRAWIKEEYRVVEMPGLEADDCLGIMQTSPDSEYEGVIWTIDKDLGTVPGLIKFDYNEVKLVTEDEADTLFYLQCLTGDTTDNYKGIPGIGPAKAKKILKGKKPENMWAAVVQAYRKAGMSYADALVQARMARILRFGDWDFEKEEVKLWTPR